MSPPATYTKHLTDPRLLTVRATLRQQQRNVLEYLTAACEAALHRRPPPSLLPVSKPTQA